MIAVSLTEGPADELQVGLKNKPATGHRMLRRPWSDRSREGAVGSEETIMLATYRRYRVAIPGTKGALLGGSAL